MSNNFKIIGCCAVVSIFLLVTMNSLKPVSLGASANLKKTERPGSLAKEHTSANSTEYREPKTPQKITNINESSQTKAAYSKISVKMETALFSFYKNYYEKKLKRTARYFSKDLQEPSANDFNDIRVNRLLGCLKRKDLTGPRLRSCQQVIYIKDGYYHERRFCPASGRDYFQPPQDVVQPMKNLLIGESWGAFTVNNENIVFNKQRERLGCKNITISDGMENGKGFLYSGYLVPPLASSAHFQKVKHEDPSLLVELFGQGGLRLDGMSFNLVRIGVIQETIERGAIETEEINRQLYKVILQERRSWTALSLVDSEDESCHLFTYSENQLDDCIMY